MAPKSIEQRYQKLTQLDHVLKRPDAYVGSLQLEQQPYWVWDGTRMRLEMIDIVPGLYKIFDEIIVNAADVKAREAQGQFRCKMTTLKVTVDRETSTFTVQNDGDGIPVEIHKEHKMYVPEMIFGHLLTSDNYDDSEERITGGRNGYGAKLTWATGRIFMQKHLF